MTLIPLRNLDLYTDWKDAPLGVLLSFAFPIFVTASGQQSGIYEGPKLAIRAESSKGAQQFLVVIEPEPLLAAQGSERLQAQIFGGAEAANGPAVRVSDQYELCVEAAPIEKQLYEDPAPLTVVRTIGDKPRTLLFAGTVGRSARYLAVDGDECGKLFEQPNGRVVVVGTLKLEPVKVT